MRYIEKEETPQFMIDWLALRESADQSVLYDEFNDKRLLNDTLRLEQKHICCYCQQILTHYQGGNYGGSHNEHLVPQNGVNANVDLQMDYTNIYACCNYSNGLQRKNQYCGQAKGGSLIPNIINDEVCSELFRYNTLGEIIPNGDFDKYEDYLQNEDSLNQNNEDALKAINVLNLNCTYLVTERKAVQTKLFIILSRVPNDIINTKIAEFEILNRHYRFIDMLLYYMRKKLNLRD